MVDWAVLAEVTNDVVDDHFGVNINLIPWGPAMIGGQPDPFKDGGEDITRTRRDALRAIFIRPDASLKAVKGGEYTNMAEADVIISIRTGSLGDIKEEDRCEIPAQGLLEYFLGSINFITPGDTGRSLLHLIKVKTG